MTLTQIIVAVFAPIAAVIIGLVVKYRYFDTQRRLRVEVRPFSSKTSGALKKIAKAALEDQNIFYGPINKQIDAGGYMTVTITNISKKKISGVSIIAHGFKFDAVW